MKVLFVPAKAKLDYRFLAKAKSKLPDEVGLVTTLQYKDYLPEIAKYLKTKGIKATVVGQVLGCNIDCVKKSKAKAFMYIGSGRFHPLGIAIYSGKEVIVADPVARSITKIDKKEIRKFEGKKKAGLVKFYSSDTIGILVTTKKGQCLEKQAFKFKNKWAKKGKKCYIFECETLDFNELENFPFIECWVNTMCPRIAYDDSFKVRKAIVNIEDID